MANPVKYPLGTQTLYVALKLRGLRLIPDNNTVKVEKNHRWRTKKGLTFMRSHSSSQRGKHQAISIQFVKDIMRSHPSVQNVSSIVEPSELVPVVVVIFLHLAVRRKSIGIGHLQHAPLLTPFAVAVKLTGLEARPLEVERRREVVEQSIAAEVQEV